MKSSFSILAAFFCLLISSQAFAGVPDVNINCKSADGLTLKGNIPSWIDFDVTISQAGKSSRFYQRPNEETGQSEGNSSNAIIVQSFGDGVYTIMIHPTEPGSVAFVQLFAIPKTVVLKRLTATFSAKLSFRSFDSMDIVDKTVRYTWKSSF